MQIGRFRLGMRTIKTALAVMLCILLFYLTDRGSPLIAALAAVFSLRQDLTTSISFGRSRVLGNSLGGLFAMIFYYIQSFFKNDFYVELFLLPFFVILVIVLSDGINNNSGIISAIATMLLIAFSIPQGESILYALNRVLDTFIGTIIAISLNGVISPQTDEKEKQIKEDLVELRKKEADLNKMLYDVKKQIKDQTQK
ncbi:aromatic acid exporter family protein [Enterococcus viikkiensis]|uniref:Aromatic acid exporter family protein n=1 Tax=Enterococcus viikkiensis TaxID=930854 RepID=A0ABU3FSV0_9ENTE|nr:aromatic acid exporter family protein [Enterococcus viikkiensis]MDT2829046.1 aromatic acid exporter family protein [Enterococcus viikkiensis]